MHHGEDDPDFESSSSSSSEDDEEEEYHPENDSSAADDEDVDNENDQEDNGAFVKELNETLPEVSITSSPSSRKQASNAEEDKEEEEEQEGSAKKKILHQVDAAAGKSGGSAVRRRIKLKRSEKKATFSYPSLKILNPCKKSTNMADFSTSSRPLAPKQSNKINKKEKGKEKEEPTNDNREDPRMYTEEMLRQAFYDDNDDDSDELSEIALLKSMIFYLGKSGGVHPCDDYEGFGGFIRELLKLDVPLAHLSEHMQRLKKRYEKIFAEKGEKPEFSDPREKEAFELSKNLWGKQNKQNRSDPHSEYDGTKQRKRQREAEGQSNDPPPRQSRVDGHNNSSSQFAKDVGSLTPRNAKKRKLMNREFEVELKKLELKLKEMKISVKKIKTHYNSAVNF